ncbi:MAG: uL4 family ribosomal protein [Candidatus Hodgkinia cicadicola]
MINSSFCKLVLTTPTGYKVSVSSANFGCYPRDDVVAEVARCQLDKRRWHVAQIKSRSDVNCSGRKMYAQKKSGHARHATFAVYQFRGGGKYAAKKARKVRRLNKKFKRLAMRSCLSLKRAASSLVVVDSFLQLKLLVVDKPLLVYYSANEVKELAKAHYDVPLICVSWSNLSVVQILRAHMLVFSVRALKKLDAKLESC